MSYSSDRDQNSSKNAGVLITKPTYRLPAVCPRFVQDSNQPTRIRWLGVPTEDQKGFLPYRRSADPYDYGDAIINRTLAIRIGTVNKFTMIADLYDETGRLLDPDANPSPIRKLINAFRFSRKTHPEWAYLDQGGPGQSKAIPMLTGSAMIQGAILEHGGKQFTSPPMFGLLFMQKSATEALELVLEEQVADYAGDPDDLAARFVHYNVLDPDKGGILSFRNRKFSASGSSGMSINFAASAVKKEQRTSEWAGFACDVQPCPPLPRTVDGRIQLAVDGLCAVPWDKVLRYLSPEEQTQYLIRAFEDRADLIKYALGNTGLLPATFTGKVISAAPRVDAGGMGGVAGSSPAAPAGGIDWGAPPPAVTTVNEEDSEETRKVMALIAEAQRVAGSNG
jgi:hypothetical protein